MLVLPTNRKEKEPALKVGVSTSAVAGILSIVAYLWPDLLSPKITTTILILSAFILPIVTAAFTRGKVWSPASVLEIVDEAVKEAQEEIKQQYRPGKRY